MAHRYADRVKETSTTTGTGTYTLAGAATGFQGFVAGIGNGNTCYYCATDGTDWETGLGTVTDATPDTLSRDTIISSSNAGAAVDWAAGTRNIFVTLPGPRAAVWSPAVDEDGTSFTNWTANTGTWASNGTEITQTNTSGERHAKLTARTPAPIYRLEADMTVVTGTGSQSRVGVIIAWDGTNFAASTVIYLQGDTTSGSTLNCDRAQQALLETLSFAWTYGTFYRLRLDVSGITVSVYLDGVHRFNVSNVGYANPNHFGLYTNTASAKWKNITMQTLTFPV